MSLEKKFSVRQEKINTSNLDGIIEGLEDTLKSLIEFKEEAIKNKEQNKEDIARLALVEDFEGKESITNTFLDVDNKLGIMINSADEDIAEAQRKIAEFKSTREKMADFLEKFKGSIN